MTMKKGKVFTMAAALEQGYTPVKFADEMRRCECCDEPWCLDHNELYADCLCIGPTEDDVDYLLVDDVLMGKRSGGVGEYQPILFAHSGPSTVNH